MSDETTAPTTSEQPKHYSPGTIKKTVGNTYGLRT